MHTVKKSIFTIGHSTHEFEDFVVILNSFHIELVADIRRYPGSGKFPWFNKEKLQPALQEKQIQYIHLPDLGGRRKPLPDSHNDTWRHPAFRGYADYMETAAFQSGITNLQQLAMRQTTVIMCAETLWWRCHRRLVADFLTASGWTVWHIMGFERAEEHLYTSPAKIVDGKLSYANGQ